MKPEYGIERSIWFGHSVDMMVPEAVLGSVPCEQQILDKEHLESHTYRCEVRVPYLKTVVCSLVPLELERALRLNSRRAPFVVAHPGG